jgi:hypothetical protein
VRIPRGSHGTERNSERVRTKKAGKHRRYPRIEGDWRLSGSIRRRPAETAVGTVEGQFQTGHRLYRGFSGHPDGRASENHLASRVVIAWREGVHGYSQPPLVAVPH